MNKPLTAPFPWYGGKRRWGKEIWQRFGDPETYIEPFAGSLAVLLHRPEPCPREIVCDLDGMICNFWRAVQWEPRTVAKWATWPTIHQDLTARHRWLIEWKKEHSEQLSQDPDFYDAKVAGWWCWGISNWIGVGFCSSFYDIRPYIRSSPGGQGIQVHRKEINVKDWMVRFQNRLLKVSVINRDWKSCTSKTILGNTKNRLTKSCAIFMDPPYLTASRKKNLYDSDFLGISDQVAKESLEWAIAHGDRYRIAYACHEKDFEIPEGWDCETLSFGGINRIDRQSKRDAILFSPACLKPESDMAP